MCSFTWSNDQEFVHMRNLQVNRKHLSSSEILLILLAICRNSNFQDNNEIKENIVMFSCLLTLSVYNFTSCVQFSLYRIPRDNTFSNIVHFCSYPVYKRAKRLALYKQVITRLQETDTTDGKDKHK